MELSVVLPFIGAILVLFIILKILALPFKLIIKLVINGLIGGVIIWVINLIGASFGFVITLNWLTAIIVGILGIPRSNYYSHFTMFYLNKYPPVKRADIYCIGKLTLQNYT